MDLGVAGQLIKAKIDKLDNESLNRLEVALKSRVDNNQRTSTTEEVLNDILVCLAFDQSDINDILLAKRQDKFYNYMSTLLFGQD
jgi:hypothetical protein